MLRTECTMRRSKEALPLDDPSALDDDASYGIYNELFPDSPDVEARSSDTLVPVVRLPSPNTRHNSRSRVAHGDLLSSAVSGLI
jgi:hypothetical protein